MSGDSNISNEKMNIVSFNKTLDDSMEQENNGTDSQITVDNTAKTSYFSAKYILVGLIADTEGRWSCFCGIVNEVF